MTRILGRMARIDDEHGTVHMEDVYDTDIDDLWSAITEPERLARWIATVEGELRVGGTFHVQFTSSWTGPGRVEVCEAPRHLRLTMEPGTADEAVIEAELIAEGEQTRLVVEERGLPLRDLHHYGAGWQAHFEDLGRYLRDGGESVWKARWDELSASYESLGLS